MSASTPPDAGVVVLVGPAVAGVFEEDDGDGPSALELLVLLELMVVLSGLISGLAKGPDRGLATLSAMMPDADMLVGP